MSTTHVILTELKEHHVPGSILYNPDPLMQTINSKMTHLFALD